MTNPLLLLLGRKNADSFAPSDISNLAAWYDASDTSTITHASGAVSQWNDKSSNAYHLTQSTGSSQPKTNSRTINSLNVLDFDGLSDFMIFPSGALSIPTGSNTVFSVFASDNAGGASQRLVQGTTAAGGPRYGIGFSATQMNVQNRSASNIATVMNDARSTYPKVYCFVRSGVNITPIINGVKGTDGTNSENFTANSLLLGAENLSIPANFFNGLFSEQIIYSKALSAAELNQVGQYLAGKWGLTWTDLS